MTPDQLRDIAIRFEAKRLETKLLLLTCHYCKEYFECAGYERYCVNCRGVRRPT
jgi:hypothetical protein